MSDPAIAPPEFPAATRQLPADLTHAERAALLVAAAPTSSQGQLRASHQDLGRVLAPIYQAAKELTLAESALLGVRLAVLRTMAATGTAYPTWDRATWSAAARAAGCYAPKVLALAHRLGRLASTDVLAFGVRPTRLARRLFGRAALERELHRVQEYLETAGYGRKAPQDPMLSGGLARLLPLAGRPKLEALTVNMIEAAHNQAEPGSELRSAYFRLGRALRAMGLLPREIPFRAWRRDRLEDIDPVWAEWCARWRTTSTLSPGTRHGTYYALLKAGRWLFKAYPEVRCPDDWTREIGLAYLAAVNTLVVGELNAPMAHQEGRRGTPVSARSKSRMLWALRIFFRDCQEWGWAERRFDPGRVFATPRSVKALISPSPRVIADDLWARLLRAGLNIGAEDLLPARGFGAASRATPVHPLAMMRALAVTWLFAGLRRNELTRLRVGCIRWQQNDGGPAAATAPENGATCLPDIPVHKTGQSFTKPVDPLVGQAIAAWELERPAQPLQIDPKTGERADLLFCLRGRPLQGRYLNRSLIPLLCRKAGVPLADARGRITSHRARSTIATQLYNAKEPMSLFELQAWLGNCSPTTTQNYVALTPTKLAKAYVDAGYFARNVRAIEVLIDQDAVRSAAAAAGEPWRYYDLGHGLYSYEFFDQCLHRMACARCDFYSPKCSSREQLLQAKSGLLHMLQDVPLTEEERAAVDEDLAALDRLVARLADTPTPLGLAPGQLASASGAKIAPACLSGDPGSDTTVESPCAEEAEPVR
ncbi:MAG: tyrosine-type recombinase/integrase [Chloroflexi bacterium]|nr:tyrosine-type recombinase/integrase [Chloroflexota bacterium]